MFLFCSLFDRCTKELNQWDNLLEFAKTKGNVNPFLVLESAWRVPNWSLMEEALSHVDMSCPKELMWKVKTIKVSDSHSLAMK